MTGGKLGGAFVLPWMSKVPRSERPLPGAHLPTACLCYGQARQAVMSMAITGPGGGSRMYCSYLERR